MTVITEKQKNEFYQGFITAMLWSTGGDADYSEAPEGYVIEGVVYDGDKWAFIDHRNVMSDAHDTNRQAIEAAWRHSGETPPDVESLEGFELAPETVINLRAHCEKWLADNYALLALYAEKIAPAGDGSTPWERAGHDFWLTSAGHGAGFWDRNLDVLGDHLTAACEQFEHKHDPYLGDDGLVYVSGF